MEGLDAIHANVEKLKQDIWRRMTNAGDEAALYLSSVSKNIGPFTDRTGLLRNSITGSKQIKPDAVRVIVSSSRFYAPFVELGTSRAQAYPFLWPAVAQSHDKLIQIVRSHFQ